MSATLLNEINEKLAKMPYLGGYSPSDEDKAILSQLRDPPIQHINALRWYNQMNHELGLNKTVKKNDESCDGKACPGEVVNNVPDGYSTKARIFTQLKLRVLALGWETIESFKKMFLKP